MSSETPNQIVQNSSSSHVRSIALDIILTLLTCGLFNLYIQYVQMLAVNSIRRSEKYNFLIWFLLTLITCGLYHIYHEYRMSRDLSEALGRPQGSESLISVILVLFGLWIVADAIQQSQINEYYGNKEL